MPICEFSGEETQTLVQVEIEGVTMQVAPEYAKYGTRVDTPTPARRVARKTTSRPTERTESVKAGAAKILRDRFSASGDDEKALARRLGMKESQLKAYLRGDRTIPIADARKLEKLFDVSLIETIELPAEETTSAYRSEEASGGLTLGDLLKEAKRR